MSAHTLASLTLFNLFQNYQKQRNLIIFVIFFKLLRLAGFELANIGAECTKCTIAAG